MRLSEAIRLGAMNRPQGYDTLYAHGGTYALGAAFDACGCYGLNLSHQQIWQLEWYGFAVMLRDFDCPVCGQIDSETIAVTTVVTHLNDKHRWTREQIATWVEGIEQADERRAVAEGQPQTETVAASVRLVPQG